MRLSPVLAALLILAVCVVPAAAGAGTEPEIVQEWSVTSDRATTGPLAVQAVFDFGDPQECVFFVGTSGPDSGLPILFWEEYGDFHGAFFSTYSAQGHVTDVAGTGITVDTREEIESGGVWHLGSTREGTFEGQLTYRMIIPDVGYWFREATGDHEGLDVRVACDRGFTVTDLALGTEAVGYTMDSLAGGDGAWVSPTIVGEAGVSAGDWLAADLSSPEVAFRLKSATSTGHAEGEATLTWPGGSDTVVLDGVADDLFVTGGPGAWRLNVDRLVAGVWDDFRGVLYGLAPVEDLAAALEALA